MKDSIRLAIHNNTISISIEGMDKLALVDYTEELFGIIESARFRVPRTDKTRESYKYPYSNKYKKYLHQMIFDYYFGENIRKKLYEEDYIIEHLDNNGFNNRISNLFALKQIKNTYKGWHLDKIIRKSKPIIALRIYHMIDNKTFQITIGLNTVFASDEQDVSISTIKLLYEYDYEVVLQDAELLIERIVRDKVINFSKWSKLYRYKDIKIEYAPKIVLSEEEKKLNPGSIIWREGVAYILIGMNEKSSGLIDSIALEKNWNLQ